MASKDSAPTYDIAPREVVAVEHPMVVRNLDNGLKTFGNGPAFSRILEAESSEACIPLYLRYNDPMCAPVLSRNIPTDNVLLKITVPKPTGRKRKRGSQAQFSGDYILSNDGAAESNGLRSQSRSDNPTELLRALRDNIGNYQIEAVATIDQTHRFRGLSDFHHSTVHTEFAPKLGNIMSSGDVASIRQFKFNPSRGWKKNEEIMPPPLYTIQTIPTNWCWQQNSSSNEQITGKITLANPARPHKSQVDSISGDSESVPGGWPYEIPSEIALQSLLEELKKAFDERPIWIRRALINRMNNHRYFSLLKPALKYVCYQFRSGPFRDCLVKYGIDPRKDAQYRIYQSIYFQALNNEAYDAHVENDSLKYGQKIENTTSHLFDGENLTLDGKTWQLCDVTDPTLAAIIQNAPVRSEFDLHDGYFNNGTWAKIRAIMKIKLHGILYKIPITNEHLEKSLKVPDIVETGKSGKVVWVPLPDFKLTEEEISQRVAQGEKESGKRNRVNPGRRKERSGREGRLKKKFARDGETNQYRSITTQKGDRGDESAQEVPLKSTENYQNNSIGDSVSIGPPVLDTNGENMKNVALDSTPEINGQEDRDHIGSPFEDYDDGLELEDDLGSEEGSEDLEMGVEIDDEASSDGMDVAGLL